GRKPAPGHLPLSLNEPPRVYFDKLATISPPDRAARYRALLAPAPPASVAQYLAESEPQHNSMLRTSVVPTMLKAGVGVNVIPSEAEATFDVRALPDEDIHVPSRHSVAPTLRLSAWRGVSLQRKLPIGSTERSAKSSSSTPMADSGEMTPEQFEAFLATTAIRIEEAACDGAICFVCMDWRHCEVLLRATKRFELKNIC